MGELLVIVGLVVAVVAIIGIIVKARGGTRPATAAPRRDPLAAAEDFGRTHIQDIGVRSTFDIDALADEL